MPSFGPLTHPALPALPAVKPGAALPARTPTAPASATPTQTPAVSATPVDQHNTHKPAAGKATPHVSFTHTDNVNQESFTEPSKETSRPRHHEEDSDLNMERYNPLNIMNTVDPLSPYFGSNSPFGG